VGLGVLGLAAGDDAWVGETVEGAAVDPEKELVEEAVGAGGGI